MKCVNDWLTVNSTTKKCECSFGLFKNMTKDPRGSGSCACDPGFYLTDKGCKTCSDLIPNCQTCALRNYNTQVPLYYNASISTSNNIPQ